MFWLALDALYSHVAFTDGGWRIHSLICWQGHSDSPSGTVEWAFHI